MSDIGIAVVCTTNKICAAAGTAETLVFCQGTITIQLAS